MTIFRSFFSPRPFRNRSVPRLIIIDFSLRINIPERNLAFGTLGKDRLEITFDHLERNFLADGCYVIFDTVDNVYISLCPDNLIRRNELQAHNAPLRLGTKFYF